MNELAWGTIPVVTVVAFTFMGIEGIADEIEMPFGAWPADPEKLALTDLVQVWTSQICRWIATAKI